MATFLYRLGRLAFRRRGYVARMWVAVLAAVGLGALQAPGASDEDFSMPGIESQKAYDLMQERFPGAATVSVPTAPERPATAPRRPGPVHAFEGPVRPIGARPVLRRGTLCPCRTTYRPFFPDSSAVSAS
ncbi:hypothetical protein [Streptomyces sp. NPDC088794]|uniref:hypothetical protein n=1 Tax=Streptomyces sp. NPDC088794 TaxID=3365902 RepID=UPI0037F69A46